MPPVKMTRAEYEAKYGAKPVISTSTLDTTPAPVRMTRQEYENIYGVKPAVQEKPGVFSRTISDIPSDVVETAKGFVGAARQGAQNIVQGVARKDVAGVVGAVVAAPSAVVNMAGEVLLGTGKLLTTDEFEKTVSKGIADVGESAMSTETGKNLARFYEALPEDQKYTLSKIIAPVANVMTGVPVGVAGAKATKAVAETAVEAVPDITTTLRDVKIPFTKKADERIANVASEIGKIEEKYAPIRKANQYSKDVEGSRLRIAQSNVLENAIDENGLLNTTEAIKAYKAQTIDGLEDVVRKNLENEAKTVNIEEIRREMQIALMDSGLEGGDLATALSGIEKELNGLSLRANELGEVPLTKIQDAKINTTNNINFQTPPETATYRKTLARVYKEVIENKSDLNVREVNSELAKFYSDIERLDRLNGRRVEGGKLGKYTASLVGTAAGMGVGSVGGGFGTAVGGIVGGEVGAMLKGRSMAGTLRGGGVGLPENKILQGAKARAEAGRVVNLKVPDKKVGAPKDIPKTKEIKKLEGQIAKNIQMQKSAIKTGDFTLVAKLKEIYTVLVEKLKEQVRFVRENIKSEGGYIKNPFFKGDQSIPLQRSQRNTTIDANTNSISPTVPKLDAEVKSNIVRILDDYTLNKNPDLELQMDAAKIAEDLGIKLPKTYGALVKKLGEVLDEADAPRAVNTPNLADDIATPSLLEEARKYKSAEEFIKSKIVTTDGYKHFEPDNYSNINDFIRDSERIETKPYEGTAKDRERIDALFKAWGNRQNVYKPEPIKLNKIRFIEGELADKPKPGRKITEPISVRQTENGYDLVDGRHRIDQAIVNGDTEIQAIIYEKSYKRQLEDMWVDSNQ